MKKILFIILFNVLVIFVLEAQWVPTTPLTSPLNDFTEINNNIYATGFAGFLFQNIYEKKYK